MGQLTAMSADQTPTTDLSNYIGRFAPSPTGPLHFGSLVCAVASFLDAKAHSGKWLLRIEDIDPPREQPGATIEIQKALEAHSLFWDGLPLLQSERSDAYKSVLEFLEQEDLLFKCTCSRKRLMLLNNCYDGHCRSHFNSSGPYALRLKVGNLPRTYKNKKSEIIFQDSICGAQKENLVETCGDFVIHRKDGLFAYQLAVVVDDIFQGITHIVRGIDLLESTARQIYLTTLLDGRIANYAHHPVITDNHGYKLSKQHGAEGLDIEKPKSNIYYSLCALQLKPPIELKKENCQTQLDWAVEKWDITRLRAVSAIKLGSIIS